MNSSGWIVQFDPLSYLHRQPVVGVGQTVPAVTPALATNSLAVNLGPYCRRVTYTDPTHSVRQFEAGSGEVDGEFSTGAFQHVAEAVSRVTIQLGGSLGRGESEVFNWKICVKS